MGSLHVYTTIVPVLQKFQVIGIIFSKSTSISSSFSKVILIFLFKKPVSCCFLQSVPTIQDIFCVFYAYWILILFSYHIPHNIGDVMYTHFLWFKSCDDQTTIIMATKQSEKWIFNLFLTFIFLCDFLILFKIIISYSSFFILIACFFQ